MSEIYERRIAELKRTIKILETQYPGEILLPGALCGKVGSCAEYKPLSPKSGAPDKTESKPETLLDMVKQLKSVECNCDEALAGDGETVNISDRVLVWVCPAHGYKRL